MKKEKILELAVYITAHIVGNPAMVVFQKAEHRITLLQNVCIEVQSAAERRGIHIEEE